MESGYLPQYLESSLRLPQVMLLLRLLGVPVFPHK